MFLSGMAIVFVLLSVQSHVPELSVAVCWQERVTEASNTQSSAK